MRPAGHLLAEQFLEAVQVPTILGEQLAVLTVHEERGDAAYALFLLDCPAACRLEGTAGQGILVSFM